MGILMVLKAGESNSISASTYGKRFKDLHTVFPPSNNPKVWYPPKSLDQFHALEKGAPALNIALRYQLFALLDEYERKKWVVNGDPLFDAQRALTIWEAMSLCQGKESPSSLLLIGPSGTGKTRLLGILMQALIRLQMRGAMEGRIAFVTNKSHHMGTKTVGRQHALMELLQPPPLPLPLTHRNRLYRDLCRMFPENMVGKLIAPSDWRELVDNRTGDRAHMRKRVQQFLGKPTNGTKDHFPRLIEAIAAILSGQAVPVAGIGEDRAPELIDFGPLQKEETAETYAGDAAFGIPKDYPVVSRNPWMVHNNGDKRELDSARVLLTTMSAFTNLSVRNSLGPVISDIRAVLCDEIRLVPETTVINRVVDAGGEKPLVVAATNIDSGKFKHVSPCHSVAESIGVMLPDVRVQTFPWKEEPHYPMGSERALKQLVDGYFAKIPHLKGKQPWEMDCLVAVHSSLTQRVAHMLDDEFARRFPRLKARVLCMDSKASDGEHFSQKEALQNWFVGPETGGPKVLVMPPSVGNDALDLPNIERLVVATTVTPDATLRLMGRGLHGNRHRTEGPQFAVLISVQQFSNSNLHSTPFGVVQHGLPIDEETGFSWISGQIFLNRLRHETEQRKLKKQKRMHVPGTNNEVSMITIADGGESLLPARKGKPFASVSVNHATSLTSKLNYTGAEPPRRELLERFLLDSEILTRLGPSEVTSLHCTAIRVHGAKENWVKALTAEVAALKQRT